MIASNTVTKQEPIMMQPKSATMQPTQHMPAQQMHMQQQQQQQLNMQQMQHHVQQPNFQMQQNAQPMYKRMYGDGNATEAVLGPQQQHLHFTNPHQQAPLQPMPMQINQQPTTCLQMQPQKFISRHGQADPGMLQNTPGSMSMPTQGKTKSTKRFIHAYELVLCLPGFCVTGSPRRVDCCAICLPHTLRRRRRHPVKRFTEKHSERTFWLFSTL